MSKIKITVDHSSVFAVDICDAQGAGKRRAISRSNSRKRMAIKKNRIENGNRAEPIGSKPHSYGDSFSVSGLFCGSQNPTVIRAIDSDTVNANISEIRFIVFS